jgi:mono/diheme cytochrome c family protein
MKFKNPSFFYFFIFSLILAPSFLHAQGNHDGNHCAVVKSPFKLSMDSGKVVYIKQCLSCHQENGLGISDVNPPLNGKIVAGDKKTLIEIIINGHATHEEINGKTYMNVMPPNPGIKDQQIADVLTYIRNSFGNKASSVKVPEVKSTRSRLK